MRVSVIDDWELRLVQGPLPSTRIWTCNKIPKSQVFVSCCEEMYIVVYFVFPFGLEMKTAFVLDIAFVQLPNPSVYAPVLFTGMLECMFLSCYVVFVFDASDVWSLCNTIWTSKVFTPKVP